MTPLFANGAMGLGLEMFSMETWTIYVAVTLVFEAWYIGRWKGYGWPASLGLSLLANAVTGFGCISICAVGLHQSFVGSTLNPNPFLNAVVLFTGYGLVSAFIEWIVWGWGQPKTAHGSTLWRTVKAHLIGVPIGLAILLIPSHPYVGVVGWTNMARLRYVEQRIKRDLPMLLQEGKSFPCVTSIEGLLSALPPSDRQSPDERFAAYEADLSRFSTGGTTGQPIAELNTSLCGLKLPPEGAPAAEPPSVWLLRKRSNRFTEGLVLDRNTGAIERTLDPAKLGMSRPTDAEPH